MRKTIAIIGHFGGNECFLDGQTIKTKILYDELNSSTDWQIIKVDTYYKKTKPIRLLLYTIATLFRTKDIIVLLSGNGMNVFFPILSFSAKVLRTRIFHDVIGGNLDEYVKKKKHFKRYLNTFTANWVETNKMKDRLEKLGITNCEVIPNFKRLPIVHDTNYIYAEPFRFCVFSRVMKEKGIEDAINAIEQINKSEGRSVCTLDIYGKIDKGYSERFNAVINNSSSAINYKGMVDYDKSVETIKRYVALLFPTYWSGEGFPGTIIDAFSAGLPVIATDFNCNNEIVKNNYNGILYPNEEIKDLKQAIQKFIGNAEMISKMKLNASKDAVKYQPDTHIERIIAELDKE